MITTSKRIARTPLLLAPRNCLLIVTQTAVARVQPHACLLRSTDALENKNEIGSVHRTDEKNAQRVNSNVIGNLAKRTLSSILIQFYGFATFTTVCYRDHLFHVFVTIFITICLFR